MDLARRKHELRRRVHGLRGSALEARTAAGQGVVEHVLGLADALPPTVALFAGREDEIDTKPFFDRLSGLGVRCLFPRCVADQLAFAPILRWEDLAPGRFGILEPPPTAPAEPLTEGGWVLVPGVAFDVSGNRLGRGRGFYDRAFPAPSRAVATDPFLVGLAIDFQIVDRVPVGPTDRKMDAVVTEVGVRYALARGRGQ